MKLSFLFFYLCIFVDIVSHIKDPVGVGADISLLNISPVATRTSSEVSSAKHGWNANTDKEC